MIACRVENLSKHYGAIKAVNKISFEVEQGGFFGFLGINGAGKSTTINMLSTLIMPDEGKAELCGLQLGRDNIKIRQKIGMVYQYNCLDDNLSVTENLMSRAYLYEKSNSVNKKRLNEVCQILALDDVKKQYYKKLSGGQKRRCEIAAALMHTPEILFLDEPTTGLDPATRKNVWEAIEHLQKKVGMTVFLTTHYMEEAAKANHIVIIDKGKVIADGTGFELKEIYATDLLKLYSEDMECVKQVLYNKHIDYDDIGESLNINIQNTLSAYDIIGEVKDFLSGFEVIQGTMDDVFLNATGNKTIGGYEL